MKHRLLAGVGLAVAMALVTPWNAVAATTPSPHADRTVNGCNFTETPTTWTLTAECTATATIHIPDGVTLIGGSNIIFVEGSFTGAVVENAGATMSIENLFIIGRRLSTTTCNAILGVFFNNASGSLTGVNVEAMTRGNGCQTGFGMLISATSAHQTVTITSSSAANFQKSGVVATGPATVNVSNSTFGFPDSMPGVIAQNVVQYSAGAGGTFTGNAVFGAASGRTDAVSTGMLLSGAAGLTVSGNAIHGLGTDMGIAVYDSTDITIQANSIAHGSSSVPNHFGTFGVFVDANSSGVTTVGNAFGGWQHDIVVADQEPYIVTTSPLPPGAMGTPYSALLLAIAEDPASDLTWSVVHGSLPPGLHLKNDAAIVGTPTQAGTFTFTLRVQDGPDGTSAEREFTFTIHPADVSLRVTKTAFPNPAAAGQPITFTITVSNGGTDAAAGVIVNDGLPAGFTGFTWRCVASAPPSRCSETSGTGSISDAPVDIAAGGTVTFTLSGILPANASGQVINTAGVTPGPGAVDPGCTPDCSASVTVPVVPALPVTGPDLLPEAAGGIGLVGLGGLILLTTRRRKRRVAS